MERAATKKTSRTAASGHGRSARSESEPQRFGERPCGIEGMLDPLEYRGQRQLRRGRREGARCQKDRGADRAIIIVVAANWRRRLRVFVSETDGVSDRSWRVLRHTMQVHVIESEHDLQRQRDQRQHRPVPLMAINPTHHPYPIAW